MDRKKFFGDARGTQTKWPPGGGPVSPHCPYVPDMPSPPGPPMTIGNMRELGVRSA